MLNSLANNVYLSTSTFYTRRYGAPTAPHLTTNWLRSTDRTGGCLSSRLIFSTFWRLVVLRTAREHNDLNTRRDLFQQVAQPRHSKRIGLRKLIVKNHRSLQLLSQCQAEEASKVDLACLPRAAGPDGPRPPQRSLVFPGSAPAQACRNGRP